jgi:diadenosine tetraphosphate (Ap4A) HIT family hydrolase
MVDHVHFHVIPKPSGSDKEGLVVGWPQTEPSKDELAAIHAELQAKL